MRKIKTVFVRDFDNHSVNIRNEVAKGCEWVFTEPCIPTRKMDGTACAIIQGKLYARLDYKNLKSKILPEGAIPCQEAPDEITGSFPYWVPATKEGVNILTEGLDGTCRIDNSYKYAVSAFIDLINQTNPTVLTELDGTYELVGPHSQGNLDNYPTDTLVKHGSIVLDLKDFSFEGIRSYLEVTPIEGIVFYGSDGKMAKIKKTDFGFVWNPRQGKRRGSNKKRNKSNSNPSDSSNSSNS